MNHFPAEINAWKNDVARRLVRLRGEVDGIMINLPMIGDPEIGMPFTGPLSPFPFVWYPTENTGGTVATGNNCSGSSQFAPDTPTLTAAGYVNQSPSTCCDDANGSFVLTQTSNTTSQAKYMSDIIAGHCVPNARWYATLFKETQHWEANISNNDTPNAYGDYLSANCIGLNSPVYLDNTVETSGAGAACSAIPGGVTITF